eukprot:CAMPEP_0204835568 /NCGR_PEP_ID=MMETSP1346-20131115/22968_1 /ASSEMBLY_ACC=CAM_ASM_000771 /TAXON_ID=215587 /ORGANISM="Aplanochytrium stocchinoi, Strain GSBS06" /LENGTH=200 /DNA_ID=CAMNT_0051969689 /DNA_START=276 /DNA_END=879 /DNA_ORIENTATION=+
MALRGNARLAVNIPYVMALPAVSRSPPVNHIRKQSHYDDDDEEEEDFFQHANKYQNLAKTKYDVTIAWETVGSFWLGSKAFLQTELIFHSAKLQFHLFCDGYGSNKVYAFCLTIRKSVNTIWGGSRLGKEETNGMVPSPPITLDVRPSAWRNSIRNIVFEYLELVIIYALYTKENTIVASDLENARSTFFDYDPMDPHKV